MITEVSQEAHSHSADREILYC